MRPLSLLVMASALMAACATPSPVVRFESDTPADLVELAEATFARMIDAFPARRRCIGTVTVAGVRELPDRALYEPRDRRITLRVPATASQLEESIVHELAHHLEASCRSHLDLRAPFLESLGLDPAADWFVGEAWQDIPSEQYASGVVEYVLGRRDQASNVVLDDTSLESIEAWATGVTPASP